MTDFLFKVSILSNTGFPLSDVPSSRPPREGCGDVAGMFSRYPYHQMGPQPCVAVR